jgi:hypothetical protein
MQQSRPSTTAPVSTPASTLLIVDHHHHHVPKLLIVNVTNHVPKHQRQQSILLPRDSEKCKVLLHLAAWQNSAGSANTNGFVLMVVQSTS